MSMRFGQRLSIEREIDEELLSVQVPPLILQPLVENAFFHGIELSERQGALYIEIALQDDRLHIQVVDNGIGMPEGKLKSLRKTLENPDSATRVGLANIVRRLHLHYGDNQSFVIESECDKGTTIRVTIPYQFQEGGRKLRESADS